MKIRHQKNEIKRITIFFFKFIIIILIKPILLTNCDYDTPILRSNKCNAGCTFSQIEANNCNINNPLIQTQWLNDIIQVSPATFTYIDITTTLNGDLLVETSSSSSSLVNIRHFYGFKKNGRGYFIDKITNKEINNYSINSINSRYESFLFSIKLNDKNDDNEYLISIAKDSSRNIELYDFKNDRIYEEVLKTFFHSLQVRCIKASVIKVSNIENNYILGIIGLKFEPTAVGYFYLIKLIFNSKDIVANDPIVKTEKTVSSSARIVSCFETEKKYIMCFYQNVSLEYVIGIYDNDLKNKTFLSIEDGSPNDLVFFKAIHFTGEVGAFGYYIYNDTESHLYIQFKKYDDETNSISNYFISNPLIIIDKGGNLINITRCNDMIKLSDSKLCFTAYHGSNEKLYIIIVNNYDGEKIKIRYYYVNIYSLYYYKNSLELESSLYNNFIAIATNLNNDHDREGKKSYLMIFSYPNSTDFNLDITENIKTFSNVIIDLKEKCFINNNLFGYIFYGIKIISFNNEYEIFSIKDGNKINKDTIILDNDLIVIRLSEKINIPKMV